MKTMKHLRYHVLILLILGTVINYIDRNSLAALSPIIKKELNISNEEYSFIVSSFQFCYSLMQPVAGYITDFIGPRLGYCIFALVWGVAASLHAVAGNWQQFSLFRGMLGISEAAAMPTGVKVSTAWFPAKERSIAVGWFNAGTSLGAAIAGPLAIWLAVTWNWKVSFLVTGLLGVVLSAIWYLLYRNPEHSSALSDEERRHIASGRDAERIQGKPSWRAVLSSKRFYAVAAARFLTEPAWQTLQFWIPIYMVTVRGMDIRQFALFAWLPFLGADLGCICSGYLAPFFHKHARMTLLNSRIAGMGVGACCMIGPALVGFANDPIFVIALFSLGGFAQQMFSSLLWTSMGDLFEEKDVATSSGLSGMAAYIGGMLFTLLVGQKANAWGFEPLFACGIVFDLAAFLILAVAIGERVGRRVKIVD
jgi:ACS family hexuronate transporter-like MFS transporter